VRTAVAISTATIVAEKKFRKFLQTENLTNKSQQNNQFKLIKQCNT